MTVKVTWSPITTRKDGAAATPDHYELDLQVSGASTFTNLSQPKSADVEFDFDTPAPGAYAIRLRGIDSAGNPGDYSTGVFTIPDTSPLSAPGNLTVALA